MASYAPATHLETHDVTNQPGGFAPRNLYATDTALREAVRREAGDWLDARMQQLGAIVGSERVLELGEQANRFPPEFTPFDRYGRRLDEARFHPAYHELMALAMQHDIHDLPWIEEQAKGRHLGHMAMLALFTQAEAGTMCPINMTYASVPALRWQPDVTQPWLDRLIGGRYDADLKPIDRKAGITLGMAMTEKQGGSDVRANATKAYPIEAANRLYRLVGHKWFCSAPMSDGFLTLAYADGGIACFLVPRILPDGSRNTLRVVRLKDKLGNRSNASAEIEYHDTQALLLGEEGRGINVIIDMVHHTRLGTVGATLGIMRRALAEAVNHVEGRAAFQKQLIDQPLMRAVIADLALEYEAAVALAARVGAAFGAGDEAGAALARLCGRGGEILADQAQPGLRLRVHGVPRRRRLRRGHADAAAVPREPGQRHLGGLGQRHRPRRAAHAPPRARRPRSLRGRARRRRRRQRRLRRGRRRLRAPALRHPGGGRRPAGRRAHGAAAAGLAPHPARPFGGRRRLLRHPPRSRRRPPLRRPAEGRRHRRHPGAADGPMSAA